jgi:hypothetical protein
VTSGAAGRDKNRDTMHEALNSTSGWRPGAKLTGRRGT